MTKVRNLAFPVLAGVLAVSLVGCGRSSGYAPVSGVVTLNGKPYRNAVVLFLPESTKEDPTPGRGSVGHTDENGRFSLKSVDGVEGATVGKHHVRITSKYSKELKGYEFWDADSHKVVRADIDPIPPAWNAKANQEFDVPPGGTTKADFKIVNTKLPKR